MAYRTDVIERGGEVKDNDCRYKWNWSWVDKESVEFDEKGVEKGKIKYDVWLRKLKEPGKAYCILCRKEISYENRSIHAVQMHADTDIHKDRIKNERNNTSLPGHPVQKISTYGVHPQLVTVPLSEPKTLDPLVPLDDRIKNMEAITLGFVAENSLSLCLVPKLLAYAKIMASDNRALPSVTMDRTVASYKMRHGLAKTLRNAFLEELKISHFSLNIDEASSKTNLKALAVLVSHFSPSQKRIMVHHLDAFSLVKVTSEALFDEIDQCMQKHDLDYSMLVSILMDSCRVMRSGKSGLEVRIRRRAPHLLDIDGDSCHHANNAAYQFCQPFQHHVEQMLTDMHTEFHWSTEQREWLMQLCVVLGIKATVQEQYVPHICTGCDG